MASKMVPPKGPAPKGAPMSVAQKAAVSAAAKAGNPVIAATPKGVPDFKRRPPMSSAPAPKASKSMKAPAVKAPAIKAPSEKLAFQPTEVTGNRAAMKVTRAGLPDKRVVPNKEKATTRQGTSVGKQSTATGAYKRGGERGMPKSMKAPAGARPPIPVPTVKDKTTGMRRPDMRSTDDRRFILKGQGKAAYAEAKAARAAAAKAAARKAAIKMGGKVFGRVAGPLGALGILGEVADMVKQDRANVSAEFARRAKVRAARDSAAAAASAPKKTALQKSQDQFIQNYAAKAKSGKGISKAESMALGKIAYARSKGGNFVGPKIVGSRKRK